VALASVAVLSRVAVRTAYVRLETEARAVRLSGLASVLDNVPESPDAQIDARLAQAASSLGVRLLLLGPDGHVRAASSPELRAARVVAQGDRLQIEERAMENGVVRLRKTVLVGALHVPVADGRGRLYALPPAHEDEQPPEPRSLATLNRWLLFSALGSGVLAVLLTLALSRRILAPVEALTGAVRRMGSGDLDARVEEGGPDEIGTLARAFNAMADALARTEGLRRTLVTDVAHELRTPLTNLRCQIEALQDGLQPAGPVALASLHEETLLLARLVDDLQDLALAESGRLPMRLSSLPVDEVVMAALASMRTSARGRGITLHAEVPPGLAVSADRERLGQVLRNLLANAETHTPEGGTISVTVDRAGDRVRLVVADTGTGIAAEHLPHVFDRFYRADPSRARATGGAGLGLAIVKQIVEAHGGTVGVDSEPGQGTRFTISLPAAPSTPS
jgi:signal transduction histidine kinase